jgi:uncharacterized protein YfkK (UPF0435 family)
MPLALLLGPAYGADTTKKKDAAKADAAKSAATADDASGDKPAKPGNPFDDVGKGAKSKSAAGKVADPFADLAGSEKSSGSHAGKTSVNANKHDLVEEIFALPRGVVLRDDRLTDYNNIKKKELPKVQDVVKRLEESTSTAEKDKVAHELRPLRAKIRDLIAPIVARENEKRRQDELRDLQREKQLLQQLQQRNNNYRGAPY